MPFDYPSQYPTAFGAQPMMMAQPQPMMMAQPQPMMMAMPQPVMTAMPQPMMVMQQRTRPAGGQHVHDDGQHAPLTGNVHMLCTGIDYACDHQSWAGPPPYGHGPLDTKYAFNMMVDLAQKSGVTSLTQLWNQQCTKDNICNHIVDVGRRCGPGDTFVFYYTGHGDQLDNIDPNDPEQKDQCLCTVDAAGNTDDPSMQYRQQVWLRDDAIAAAIQAAVMPQAKSLILIDACHSGTICDFATNPKWGQRGLKACSISGCQDAQTSAGTGKGGVYTRAMTLAIQEIQQTHGHGAFMVSCIYNATLQKYKQTNPPGHEQNISIHGCGVASQQFPWPLQPQGQYVSPVNQPLPTYAAPPAQFATYAAPPVQYAAPRPSARPVAYVAPQQTYVAPAPVMYAAPAQTYAAHQPAPVTYAAPAQGYATPRPAPVTYAAPVQTMQSYSGVAQQQMTYAAPQQAVTYAAPMQQQYGW